MEGGGSWCDSDFLLFLPGEGDFFLLLRAFSFAAFACGLHGAGRHMLDGDGFERDGCGCFVALSLCSEELYRDAARNAACTPHANDSTSLALVEIAEFAEFR